MNSIGAKKYCVHLFVIALSAAFAIATLFGCGSNVSSVSLSDDQVIRSWKPAASSNQKTPSNFNVVEAQMATKLGANNPEEAIDVMEKEMAEGQSSNPVVSSQIVNDTLYGWVVSTTCNFASEKGKTTTIDRFVFNKDIYDPETSTFVSPVKNVIESVFNQLTYFDVNDISGSFIVTSQIREEDNVFIYEAYISETSFGDYGVQDTHSLNKETYRVDKSTGKVTHDSECIAEKETDGALTNRDF